MNIRRTLMSALAGVAAVCFSACGSTTPAAPPGPAAGSGDAPFTQLAREILEDHFKRHPSESTDLGVHKYDDQLEDLSRGAIDAESAALKAFTSRLDAVDPASLSAANVLDRE